MVKLPSAIAVALLLALVVVPVGAGAAAAPNESAGTIIQLPAATPADLDAATDLQTDYSWDKPGIVRTATALPPVERRGWPQTLAQLAPAVLLLTLVVLGLTITFTSLRRDMKHRRPIPYRPRGAHSIGPDSSYPANRDGVRRSR